jgi:hypothetical protein
VAAILLVHRPDVTGTDRVERSVGQAAAMRCKYVP